MLVHRQTFIVKPGKWEEAIKVLKTGADHLDNRPPFRVYGSYIGNNDTIVLELEFENMTEYERFWNAWFAAPESAAVGEKWNQLHLPGGTNEVWQLL